jgi:hypothetical protein
MYGHHPSRNTLREICYLTWKAPYIYEYPSLREDKGSYTYSLREGVMLHLIIGVRSLLHS